ncbi:TetR/AcrR family transcriptional regulator [Gilvibacter sediminis]|uniref:TetR/AcrR family transcriptional regulator n=1 Tax=Gilvibacter sediminis TaxID=379071 RepID=UPI00235034A4|nr:TetR/AcrR family transcriptional regulator [Gilvibacter sediminis]MDC7997335.1 TetR/AcrR family transcriptional regulator [Gilvibacter sediminis]
MKKERLLIAATALAAQQGLHATSMKSIARQANIAVGTIYQFYPSKDELYGNLLELFYQKLNSKLDSLNLELDFIPLMEQTYQSLFCVLTEDPTAFELFLQLRTLNNYTPFAKKQQELLEQQLAQITEVGKSAVLIRNFSNKTAGKLFFEQICTHAKLAIDQPHEQAWNTPELFTQAAISSLLKD